MPTTSRRFATATCTGSRTCWRAEPEPFTAPTALRRGRVLDVHLGLDRRSQGRQACPHQPDGGGAADGPGLIGIREDDVVFSAAKLFFSYGMGNAMAFPMSVGATTVLLPQRPTPDAVFETMRRHRPTIFYGVPTLYASLLAHRTCGAAPAPTVFGSASRPAKRCRRISANAGALSLASTCSTASARPRCSQTFLLNRPGDVRYGSTGKPVPGYEVQIVDEVDASCRTARSANSSCADRRPARATGISAPKSRRTFVGDWTYTGDKFVRDADGYFHYCGRTDDMFKVSGMWVSPFEVEAALVSHEAVLEAAVIGKEDADGLDQAEGFHRAQDRRCG